MGEIGRWYKAASALTLFFISLRLVWDIDAYAGPLSLDYPVMVVAGIILALTGGLIAFCAQITMAASWRIGIPDDKPGALVKSGPFRFSRNPFFLGLALYIAGLFFMLPCWLLLTSLLLTLACMNIQIRLEETFLEASLGQPYRDYKARTRRWL